LKRELKGGVQARAEAGANVEVLDFATARSKHQQWFDRLRRFLDGKTTLTVEEAGSHKECALGKWLYSTGLKEHGEVGELVELEKTHAGFHALVRHIVELATAGRYAQAEQEFSDVKPTSAKIVELLTAAERKVQESQNVNIVVLQADDRQFGLVVDAINDTEEIVVKPLGKQLKGIATFAGATIMGDGRVALILDVLGLAQQARVVTETRDRGLVEKATTVREKSKGLQTLLLFRNPDGGRMAIPLSLVARLEEFERTAVEKTGSQCVVQYRGEILPLIFLYSALGGKEGEMGSSEGAETRSDSEKIQVVVYTEHGRSAGLVVDRILDIVESDEAVQSKLARKGTLGMMVTQGRVTELLDVEAMLAHLGANFVEESVSTGAGA
jgi:chemotaxis protein histidine kinase CheA